MCRRRKSQGGAAARSEPNPPIFVYDASGPYTDPEARIDIRQGLPPLRQKWILERGDTAELAGPSSRYGRERLADAKLAQLRFNLARRPLRATSGRNVTQMHYARRGTITPEMEFIAIRENLRRREYVASLRSSGPTGAKMAELLLRQHPGQSFGATIPVEITPEFVRAEVAHKSLALIKFDGRPFVIVVADVTDKTDRGLRKRQQTTFHCGDRHAGAGMRMQHAGDVRARFMNGAVDHVTRLVNVIIGVWLPDDLAIDVDLHETRGGNFLVEQPIEVKQHDVFFAWNARRDDNISGIRGRS